MIPSNAPTTIQLPLIGLCGTRGSGKDTVACLMAPSGWQRIAFADTLKEAAQRIYGLSHEQVHGALASKEAIDPRWGLSPRAILQRLGTEVGRAIHPETWTRSLLDVWVVAEEQRKGVCRSEGMPPWCAGGPGGWVVTDCRFPNEADAVRRHGGWVVKVERPGWAPGGAAALHASETEVASIQGDFTISNDSDLHALQIATTRMLVAFRQSSHSKTFLR